jgi:hypothetical protein
MPDLLFVLVLGLLLGSLLLWGFRTLPGERWQILATLPLSKNENGSWRGINITWYGLLSATAYMLASALLFVLAGSIGVPPLVTLAIVALVHTVAMPAARIMALLVEKKKHTFTIAGARNIRPAAAWPVRLCKFCGEAIHSAFQVLAYSGFFDHISYRFLKASGFFSSN